MSALQPGGRIPALIAVRPADVPAGANIWGYQEPHQKDFVLFTAPACCKDGAKQIPNHGLVWLGDRFGDADHDALILIEETV